MNETKPPPPLASERQRRLARQIHGSDDCQIDDDALLSPADDGYWVGAWVWVPGEEDGEYEPPIEEITRENEHLADVCPGCGQRRVLAYVPWQGIASVPGGQVCAQCATIQTQL